MNITSMLLKRITGGSSANRPAIRCQDCIKSRAWGFQYVGPALTGKINVELQETSICPSVREQPVIEHLALLLVGDMR
jgi:hypothetical protein